MPRKNKTSLRRVKCFFLAPPFLLLTQLRMAHPSRFSKRGQSHDAENAKGWSILLRNHVSRNQNQLALAIHCNSEGIEPPLEIPCHGGPENQNYSCSLPSSIPLCFCICSCLICLNLACCSGVSTALIWSCKDS